MKIVIAPDKFKGSLDSFEVCHAIEKGLLQASASFNTIKLPMADGGDGLSNVVAYYTNARLQGASVQDPLGRIIDAHWLLSFDGKTAFIEMAKASGLQLLKQNEYNPLLTSSYGTGQLIKAAIDKGVQNIILGIGGSATNDGGIGMAAALGYLFLDENERDLPPIGKNLSRIKKIVAGEKEGSKNINFQIACDVRNFLFGDTGAARIYAPQKGANPLMVEELERGMIHFASVIKNDLGVDVATIEGGGAAGGMGAGCVAFLNGKLVSGIDLIIQMAAVEDHIRDCDVVITGEGKIDDQSLYGKAVSGIALLAKKHRKRLIAMCGSLSAEASRLNQLGFEKVYPILDDTISLQDAMKDAEKMLTRLSELCGNYLLS